MSFHHYREPSPGDYDTDEEYQDACAAWENAEDDYAEEYMERMRAERG